MKWWSVHELSKDFCFMSDGGFPKIVKCCKQAAAQEELHKHCRTRAA